MVKGNRRYVFHSLPSFRVNKVARTVATVIGAKRAALQSI